MQIYKIILDKQLLKKNKFIFNKMYFVLIFFVTLIYQSLRLDAHKVSVSRLQPTYIFFLDIKK